MRPQSLALQIGIDVNMMLQNDTNEVVLSVTGVEIDYLVMSHRYTSLKELALATLTGKLKKSKKFAALKSVDFELKRGETVGLIGRNGSGKSTLLKTCADILNPAAGKITRVGTLTSLIELGAGFDGELSAEENVYLSCMLMGFDRKLIRQNIDRIFDFAELNNFRKFAVKSFSSGMHARLGFACATLIDADIILVDEVLAVGDEAFQLKCLKHMQYLKDSGRSIVFVSHDLGTVQTFCDRVYVLEAGKVIYEGDPKIAVERLRSVLLPEQHRKKIGDLSEGLKITFGPSILKDVREDFSLIFSCKKSLAGYRWKFQIFGFGLQKPLIVIRSDELGLLKSLGILTPVDDVDFNAFELKLSRFPFFAGEFMAFFTLLDGEAEVAHISDGFRFHNNEMADNEEYGILDICRYAPTV